MYEFNLENGKYAPLGYRLVKVYQCDKTAYKFMSYDFAKSHGLDSMEAFDKDYKLVATFAIRYDDSDNWCTNSLNQIYDDGNNGTLQQHFKMHSISMSDIIEIDGRKHYVDTFGFVEMR